MPNRFMLLLASLLLVLAAPAVALAACDPQPPNCNDAGNLNVPTLECLSATQTSITLNVCAGASGAPAGITVQWGVFDPNLGYCHEAYSENGLLCELSLSGNCNVGTWSLPANGCKDLKINANTVIDQNANGCGASAHGDNCGDLTCDTQYIFFVFAHAQGGRDGLDRSCFSEGVVCSTEPCDGGGGDCPKTWGYWKTHGPEGCDPSGQQGNLWPAGNQTVGGLSLDHDALCAIFQQTPKACAKGGGANAGANAVLILEHQLIAAELNLASGALDCDWVNAAIADANALLDGFEYACIGTSTAAGQDMLAVKDVLATYNEDEVNCTCSNLAARLAARRALPAGAADNSPSSWGRVKVIYR